MLTPDEWALTFWEDLTAHDYGSDRAEQARSGIIGPSDLVCRERARRIVVEAPITDYPSSMAAILGTYIHDGISKARARQKPHLLHEVTVEIELPNGAVMTGHADEVDPEENSVTDFKTVNDVEWRRKAGPEESHVRQVHLYALGLVQAGILKPNPTVRLAYLDRGGRNDAYVYSQVFDEEVIAIADSWVSDVIYAVRHGEEAVKDWPREKCRRFCPYYSACRPDDRAGLPIEDADAALAARIYLESHTEAKNLTTLKEQAREKLVGVDGVTEDGLLVRWTTINTDKGTYDRIDVRPV